MTSFDWIFYVNFYEDLQTANINTRETASEHYKKYGIVEKRMSNINIGEYMSTSDKYGKTLLSNFKLDYLLLPSSHLYYLICMEINGINNVVELNCGIGCLSLPIIKYLNQNQKYIGFDTRRSLIDWSNKNILPYSKLCTFILIEDYKHLPLNDNSMDVIYTGNLFSVIDMDESKCILLELYRIIKKGGKIIIPLFIISHVVPNTNSIRINRIGDQLHIYNKLGQHAYGVNDAWLSNVSTMYNIQYISFGKWIHNSDCTTYRDVIIMKK